VFDENRLKNAIWAEEVAEMSRLVIILVLVGLCVNTAAALSGSGTEADPWRIKSLADFNDFASDPNYWSGFTRLETDVNLAGLIYSTAVIAPDIDNSDFVFDGTAFTGVFDGNNHKIANLTVDDGGTGNDYPGLLGCINDGEVKNLGLEGGSVSGEKYVGGLVGDNYYDASVSDCCSTRDVSSVNFVGGLLGVNLGIVSNCFWDTDTQRHGVTESIGYNVGTVTNVAGLPTAQMQTRDTFTDAGWDFVEIWSINEGATYPVLRQEIRSDLNGDGGVNFADFAIFADHWLEGKDN
jgi:hypothetical protein